MKFKTIKIRSIYVKILIVTIVIILLAAAISAVFMTRMLSKTLKDSKIEEIKTVVDESREMILDYLKSCDQIDGELQFDANWGDSSDKFYYNLLSKMETYHELMGLTTFVADREGTIIMSFPLLPGKSVPKGYSNERLDDNIVININYYEGMYRFKERRQYEDSLKANGYVENKEDFYGLFSDMDEQYVTVSKSLDYYNKTENEWDVAGSVIMAIAVPELADARKELILIYILSTVILIILDFVAMSIFANKITEPIKNLDQGAEKLAKGDFSAKIERTSDDELGDLVDTFNRMTESLSRMDAVKTEFISNVSHELRTPITSIRGFLEAIIDGVVPKDKEEYYLGLCRDESERMNNLINELLDMTRIEFAKSNMFETFDINALIAEHLIKMEPQINEKEIDVDLNFEKESQLVTAGKASISRVIINLVHNSIKFTPKGGNITISTKETDGKVEISVADTGIGIAPEEVERVFERFYKSDKSRGMDKTGTGLGLAIVKKIIDSHGETIECQSTQGEGTTFIFTLKAADANL